MSGQQNEQLFPGKGGHKLVSTKRIYLCSFLFLSNFCKHEKVSFDVFSVFNDCSDLGQLA